MEKLAREKIALQQRLNNLKKDLTAQWEHLDLTAILPPSAPGRNAFNYRLCCL